MAAAVARAAWQRANRCFVQEDAKRAPKLASCQSSNSSSKQADSGPVSAADPPDYPAIGFMSSFNGTPYSDLPPDSKWWLHMQPNYVHQRGVNVDQFDGRKTDVDPPSPDKLGCHSQDDPSSVCDDSINYEVFESFFDEKKHPELRSGEMNVVDSKVDQDVLDVKNMTDFYELLEMEVIGDSVSKQSSDFSSNVDSSLMGGDKVPWWRVTDEEELASFVAHKSLLHIENCDLPPPQKMKVRREPCKQAKSMDHDEIFMASLERAAISSPSSGGSQRRHWPSVDMELSQNENIANEPLSSNSHDILEKRSISVNDPGKAKLLEALCHSQTRAREADKAAKQAYTENEHILKLFFRQASQLFAYKQWFKMLQLENLLLHSRNHNLSPSSSFSDQLPWMTGKPHKSRNSWQKPSKAKRRKRGSHENDIGKYAVAFAVGFTLVGAGLILGWTVGWLLPAF